MKLLPALLGLALLVAGPASGSAASGEADVTSAAAIIALGRAAAPTPTARATGDIAAQVAAWKQQLSGDAQLASAVAQQAFFDAFGRAPAANEVPANTALTYAEWMQRHVQTLTEQPDKYEAAIRAAYPLVIHRDVYPEEIAYWKKYGTVPYYLLVASIDDWARRNQPGLMVTSGTPSVSVNCQYLATQQVAPAAAAPLRELLHLATASQSTAGRVLAVGGGALESDGGIYFVAAGQPVEAQRR